MKTSKILENREIKGRGGGGGGGVAEQQHDISMVTIYFYTKKVAEDYRKCLFSRSLFICVG